MLSTNLKYIHYKKNILELSKLMLHTCHAALKVHVVQLFNSKMKWESFNCYVTCMCFVFFSSMWHQLLSLPCSLYCQRGKGILRVCWELFHRWAVCVWDWWCHLQKSVSPEESQLWGEEEDQPSLPRKVPQIQ